MIHIYNLKEEGFIDINGIRFSRIVDEKDETLETIYREIYTTAHNNLYYNLHLELMVDKDIDATGFVKADIDKEEEMTILNLMLSTFKFLD